MKSSLSTMWAIGRFERAADFVARANHVGFKWVELNHAITRGMVDEFRALHKGGSVNVSSVHAPCPRWERSDGLQPEISATDERVRIAAVDLVKRTIDLAAELEGEAVVVHAGRVEMNFRLEDEIRRLFQAGHLYSAQYHRAKSELIAARAAARDAHLQASFRSMEEIAEHAAARGIRIGLETRYHYYEIPLPDELEMLLNGLAAETVYYWHDFGHAHTLATLDLVNLDSWLPSFHQSTLGLHIHDAIALRDHRAAGFGDIDFAAAKRWVPASALRVCEFDEGTTEEDLRKGYEYLKQLGYL